jgi:hypothetical protein
LARQSEIAVAALGTVETRLESNSVSFCVGIATDAQIARPAICRQTAAKRERTPQGRSRAEA